RRLEGDFKALQDLQSIDQELLSSAVIRMRGQERSY
ncbi:MAG: hypothetical protein ACI9P7_001685, partial [Candidatus Azotimanducaceae bacterium]